MYRRLIVVVLISLLFACSKSNTNPNGTLPTLNSFSFNQSDNSIPVNSNATIDGGQVTIFLPPGTAVNHLIARFTASSGATVTVLETDQQSGVTANDFSKTLTYTVKTGSQSQDYTVHLITDIKPIDELVNKFMAKYNVPGMSVSVTKDNRLVYSKSYGYADTSAHQPVTNSNLFRLASDSKQFTAVTIMRLLDQKKIAMTDKIFGEGAILGTAYGTKPYGTGITDITVSDLLHHTGGGWSADGNAYNNYNDPMFSNLSMNNAQLISWTLDNMPLDTLPNTRFEYSNFGFFLLARVIEKITGEAYAQAVQDLVLTPCGITDMRIAGNTLADRAQNEVVYYNQETQNPYFGLNISRADGCAGWIASSVDLIKFNTRINQLNPATDLLSANAYTVMTSTTPASNGYACGWSVYPDQEGFEHEGALPGTSSDQAFQTLLMNPNNTGNFSFGIVVNTRSLDNNYGTDLDNIFWHARPNISVWPSYDLLAVSQ
ncbi:MAG TPA: serine hydrolase domain-containing protein [Puia sp.]|nr:serine hydrolase domain-containing protein [Puia sp.]